ncbi:MAG: peptide chain release factor 2 [Candidatus Kerfeldbacteria bacterium]|nr:peptide chain release factor 2 [Candidatus Kerfeldbacteria bacterium]
MDVQEIQDLESRIQSTCTLLHIADKRAEAAILQKKTESPDFWNDPHQARIIAQNVSELQKEIVAWDDLLARTHEAQELLQMAQSENDSGMLLDIEKNVDQLRKQFSEMEFYVLLSQQYDLNDAIVSIHAGAGGADAQDWTEMLYRMITRFAERKQFHIEVVDYSRGQEAGVKNALIRIHGRYAYGHLRSEHGVHRLVRQSPFNADALRQTSFAMIEVVPDLGEVSDIEVPESDLRIDVFRSGGKGGQSVNTTDSAVRIVHIPTGITVVCQNEKSQHQNKASALSILKGRLLKKRLDEQDAERRRLRGEHVSAEWGSQIRSYVLHPYKMVKDHRTHFEVSDPDRILDGDLQEFVESYLRWSAE